MLSLLLLTIISTPIPLLPSGDGDQCDIIAQDSEGCGRRGHQRHTGPRGNHRAHTSGAGGEHKPGALGDKLNVDLLHSSTFCLLITKLPT